MAYIRKNSQELTGYQERQPLRPSIDLKCDFVMVYGTDETMPQRVKEFARAGYAVHLMTGISWGDYQDYLDGQWDGRSHWDEAQQERDGTMVIHGPRVPYMTPTVAFSDYLTQRLKIAVDSGVEAIHLEEPEFWDRSGYSPAFAREYEIRFRRPFSPQHESLDAHWRCARLKADLFARALGRISAALKEYAKVKYGRDLRFYVPTHSLLNYTQWKIMSPEAALTDLDTVDGYIAQVWTGTSRVANVYEGVYRERTFETAFLEYGAMQEMARGTGRRMWFLNDPIEDRPSYTWENYRYNYQKTALASLMHPQVWHYEICPWPARVFDGQYPRVQPRIAQKDETSHPAPEARPIPEEYRTFLSGMFQLFGDMDQPQWAFEGAPEPVGIFLSDSCLFERTFPDTVATLPEWEGALYGNIIQNTASPADESARAESCRAFMADIEGDGAKMNTFVSSAAFPHFYGLALPLLKYGLPLRPVQLDHVRRFSGYLKDVKFAVLSYEFMKPLSPDINLSLAEWVRAGGCLIYAGDEGDPFHGVDAWWRQGGYETPARHLFEILGLPPTPEEGVYPFGRGRVAVYRENPAGICLKKEYADRWRAFVRGVLADRGTHWAYQNHLTLRRGPYRICQVLDESVTDAPKVLEGSFADLLADGFPLVRKKTVLPGEGALLYDLDRLEKGRFAVVATAARILEAEEGENALIFRAQAADRVLVYIRLQMPFAPAAFRGTDAEGEPVPLSWEYDGATGTALLSWKSTGRAVTVRAQGAAE